MKIEYETITIKKEEYDMLVQNSNMLDALHECGVDNWEGYGDAMRMVIGDDDDD